MSLRAIWQRVTGSLWFVPGVMTTLAAVLAPLMVYVDVSYLPPARIEQYWWLFGGTPDGARGVLMAIATSLITVTGVVFSITIVALQLASLQFTPGAAAALLSSGILASRGRAPARPSD